MIFFYLVSKILSWSTYILSQSIFMKQAMSRSIILTLIIIFTHPISFAQKEYSGIYPHLAVFN